MHYALALFVIALAVVHLLLLHMHASSTPIGVSGQYDRLLMQPLFLVKDAVTVMIAFIALFYVISFIPNVLGHSDNFVEANSLVTPTSIVPEWYLLAYYAILRSVPNKLLGVVLMLAAILWLLALIMDTTMIRSSVYKPLTRVVLVTGLFAFFMLISLGSKHIEAPYIVIGQITTVIYFGALLFLLPSIGLVENSLTLSNNQSLSSK